MQYVDVFVLIHLFLIISYYRTAANGHGKRRGLAASASASDRGDLGRAYRCARSEIRWQKCYSLFIDNINISLFIRTTTLAVISVILS